MADRSCGHRRRTTRRTRRCLAALAVLFGGALAWVVWTRRAETRALSADPWATPAPLTTVQPADAPAEPSPAPAATEPADPAPSAVPPDEPFGAGSAAARPDGSAPEGFDIKGNANSKLYHPSDSPYYGRTKAEVWFRDEASAQAAGFQRWDHKRRG